MNDFDASVNAHDVSMNARWQVWPDWGKKQQKDTKLVKERDPTLVGDNVGSTGEKKSTHSCSL